jgi:hypothetical protein
VKRLRTPKYDYLDDLRKKLSVLDPEVMNVTILDSQFTDRLYIGCHNEY